jgi:hypothetical protein
MKSRGVMGNTNIVEKIVQIEDKEKMAEFEAKLEQEKKTIRDKAEQERADIEN